MFNKRLYFLIFLLGYISSFILKYINANYEYSDYNQIYQIVRNILLPLTFFLLLLQVSFSKKEIISICGLGLISLIISYFSGDLFIINLFLFIAFSKGIDIKNVIRITFVVNAFLFFIIFINFLIKHYIYGNASYILDTRFGERYTFELFHPNSFPLRYFLFVSLYILIREKLYLIELALLSVLNLVIFYFTHSRTSLYIIFLLIFSSYIHQYIEYMKYGALQFLSKFIFIIFITSWLLLSLLYSHSWNEHLDYINIILSDRIYYSSISISEIPISTFGYNLKEHMQIKDFPIDVMYIYMLLSYGLIFTIIYGFISYNLSKTLIINGLYKELIITIFFSIYSCLERTMLDISINYSLFFISFILYKISLDNYTSSTKIGKIRR